MMWLIVLMKVDVGPKMRPSETSPRRRWVVCNLI